MGALFGRWVQWYQSAKKRRTREHRQKVLCFLLELFSSHQASCRKQYPGELNSSAFWCMLARAVMLGSPKARTVIQHKNHGRGTCGRGWRLGYVFVTCMILRTRPLVMYLSPSPAKFLGMISVWTPECTSTSVRTYRT